MQTKNKIMQLKNKKVFFSLLLFILILIIFGCTAPASTENGAANISTEEILVIPAGSISTFLDSNLDICVSAENGKPIVRMIGTTWCPHCKWTGTAFDVVAKDYMDKNKIIAYHWQADIGDNTITPEKEAQMPDSENKLFVQFNPKGTIPTYVFGCKYYRIANGFEAKKDIRAEIAEFKAVIEALIRESS